MKKRFNKITQLLNCTALGALIAAALFIPQELKACGADTFITAEYQIYCEEIGQAYKICPEFLEAVIEVESNGNPDAVGADYLAELFEEYDDIGTVLMFYNGTENAEERGRCGNYTDYAKQVMERSEQLECLHKK